MLTQFVTTRFLLQLQLFNLILFDLLLNIVCELFLLFGHASYRVIS